MRVLTTSVAGLEKATPKEVRETLKKVRNFLVNDLRSDCHHCGEPFEFDYPWVRDPDVHVPNAGGC
jgi:hypothetical protein